MNRNDFFLLVSDRPTTELARIQLAYWLAKNSHRPFKRDNGERFFEHPRSVARSLIVHGFKKTDFVITGLLHDVIEDTNTPSTVMVDLFGPEIWYYLETLSRYMPLFDPITGQIKGRYKKSVEEYYEAIYKSNDLVKTVKCSDRLNNLETCDMWDKERQYRYILETEKHVLPIAEQLHTTYEDELKVVISSLKAK